MAAASLVLAVTACGDATSGSDMDFEAADRSTRELVDGLIQHLGLEPDGQIDERIPCRGDGVATSYVVRGPTPSDEVLDEAVRWLEGRGLEVDDRRPRVDQLGTVQDGIILQVTRSFDGQQLTVSGNSGCREQ